MTTKPTPVSLHRQALKEFPTDSTARIRRYGELMEEHGFVTRIPRCEALFEEGGIEYVTIEEQPEGADETVLGRVSDSLRCGRVPHDDGDHELWVPGIGLVRWKEAR